MLNNQNLILVAISIVSLTSIYLLYTNYQKMQDVAMIREEIVLLKSSLSKMNTYENELFIKINERLKQLEAGLVVGKVPVNTTVSSEQTNSELTEDNVELLNQTYQDEPNIVEITTEGLEPLNLDVEEIEELNGIQNTTDDINEIITDEMRDTSDTEHNDVLNNNNGLDIEDSVEIEDIDLEELDNSEFDNNSIDDEQVIEQLQEINQVDEPLKVSDLDNTTEEVSSKNGLNINNQNLELKTNINIRLDELINNKENVEEEVTINTETIINTETTESKSPLDSFLIENGTDILQDELDDDIDLDDLDDLNEEENPIPTPNDLSENYLNGLTVKELKVITKQKGLKTRGNKKELINVILGNK